MASIPPEPARDLIVKNRYIDGLFIRIGDAVREQPIDTTYRPRSKPITIAGDAFMPLNLGPFRSPVTQPLPADPLLLFLEFIPISLVEKWARYTTSAYPSESLGVAQVYVFLASLLYIGIHRESNFDEY